MKNLETIAVLDAKIIALELQLDSLRESISEVSEIIDKLDENPAFESDDFAQLKHDIHARKLSSLMDTAATLERAVDAFTCLRATL